MPKPVKNIRTIFSGEEIVLTDVWNIFWARRIYVIISVTVFAILGVIAAKTSPVEYEAKCVVLLAEKGSASVSSGTSLLASLAGVPTPAGGDGNDIGSAIYPIILGSKPFLIELANDTFHDKTTGQITTLKQYLQRGVKPNAIARSKDFIFGFPGTVTALFKSEPKPSPQAHVPVVKIEDIEVGNTLSSNVKIIKLSGTDLAASGALASRIKLTPMGNQLTLTVKMPEAWLSAQATQMVLDKLIVYVTKYKTSKQLETLRFLEARTAEAAQVYKLNQQRVAGFKDNNYGVVYQSIQTQQQSLQNEFELSLTLYNNLSAQLQQARIQLKKDTPLFTLLEPVYVPNGPSEPNPSKIMMSYVLLGIFVGAIIVFIVVGKSFFVKTKTYSTETTEVIV